MTQVHVLVDLENNQPTLEALRQCVPDLTDVWLFHSKQQVKRLASYEPLGANQTPVPISRPGKNSLDFHLAFYLGYIASRNPSAKLVVAAIDGDYEPMIEHARSLGFKVARVRMGAVATAKKAPAKKMAGKATAPPTVTAAAKKAPKAVKPAVPKKKVPAAKAAAVVVKKRAPAKAMKVPSKKAPTKKAIAASVPRKDRFASIVGTLDANVKGRPQTKPALESFVKTALGPSSTGSQITAMVERLVTANVVQVHGMKVSYPANAAT